MCNFHVGQKVICIDDQFSDPDFAEMINSPKKGQIYTVRSIEILTNCWGRSEVVIRLVEIVNPVMEWSVGDAEVGFFPVRFRPVVDKKTDISIFKAMLTPKNEQVPA